MPALKDPITGRYTKKNAKQLEKAFELYKQRLGSRLVRNAKLLAPTFIAGLDHYGVPIDTGNLHDSIGITLWKEGMVVKSWNANPIAVKPQHWGDFNGLIDAGKGFGKDYLARVSKVDYPGEMGLYPDASLILFASIPYAAPLSDPDAVIDEGKSIASEFGYDYERKMHRYYKNWFPKMRKAFIKACAANIKKSFIEGSDQFGGWAAPDGKTDPLRFEINVETLDE